MYPSECGLTRIRSHTPGLIMNDLGYKSHHTGCPSHYAYTHIHTHTTPTHFHPHTHTQTSAHTHTRLHIHTHTHLHSSCHKRQVGHAELHSQRTPARLHRQATHRQVSACAHTCEYKYVWKCMCVCECVFVYVYVCVRGSTDRQATHEQMIACVLYACV
jgi:hypothetical protein